MIHRPWLKKITAELGKVTKKKDYAVAFFKANLNYWLKTVFTVAILGRVKPEPSKEEIQITILGISDTDSMVMYLCVSFGSNCTAPATRLF